MESQANSVVQDIQQNDRSSFNHPIPFNEENRRILPIMLSLLFLISLLVPRFIGGNAEEYTSFCQLTKIEPVDILKDKSGNFLVLNDSNNSFNNGTLMQENEEIELFRARECLCAKLEKPQYCLFDQGDTCGIPRDKNSPVGCFFLDSRTVFIRNAWPVVLLWYGALLLFLVATENGRNARNYLMSLCFKSRNIAIADQIVTREIQLRDQMRLAAMAQQRRVMELARVRREEENPTLVLKTKTYCSPKKSPSKVEARNRSLEDDLKTPEKKTRSSSFDNMVQDTSEIESTSSSENNKNSTSFVYNENEEEVCCTICMVPIEDGDRVGALPCNHLFHSACLKQWIKRRNVCPLCQQPDIATPQRNMTANAQRSSPHETNYSQVRQEIDDLPGVREVNIVTNTLTDWSQRRQPLIIDTRSNLFFGAPVVPPAPRARAERRLQRLTLTEDGEVQVTQQISRVRTRRDVRLARQRVLRFISGNSTARPNQSTNRSQGSNEQGDQDSNV